MRASATLALACLACAPSAPSGPRLLHEAAPSSFWDAPFPSDERRVDGRVRLDGFPNPGRVPLVDKGLALLASDARGFGQSSGVFFSATVPIDPASLEGQLALLDADSGELHPSHAFAALEPGPFAPPPPLAILPDNGRPLAPARRYLAVVRDGVRASDGASLAPIPSELADAHAALLERLGLDPERLVGLTVFTTDDPLAPFDAMLARARAEWSPVPVRAAQLEAHPDFCVFSAELGLPDFQAGELPYAEEGGAWSAGPPRLARSRLVLTVPRVDPGPAGLPLAVFVRTGGGGDRPLVDRGVRGADGRPLAPATGPALELARAGFAGLSVDGPHGGPRNPSGADEQFLMFNFQNPAALRDNVRQSALELALLPSVISRLEVDTASCAGAPRELRFDAAHLALMGHSMGATIAPLAAYGAPEYRALVLSGAGASWIENVLHKRKPLAVKAIAEALLGYTDRGLALTEADPVLSIVQWAIEAADPLVFAPSLEARAELHVLMLQGIVDHYIMPPIASALSVSLGLELGGAPLDRDTPEIAAFGSVADRLASVALPARANVSGATRVLVQHAEDGVEDGHEVAFQTDAPKAEYRCFLSSYARGGAPVVPGPEGCPTP